MTLRVEGALDSAALAGALGEIVRRHEALRTVFAVAGSSPAQVILPAGPFRLPVVDLSGLPAGRREPLVLALAAEEAGRPFALAHGSAGGPLLRGVLLRLAAEDHAAALTAHHIASDGWSMGILVREVAALYPAFLAGRPSPLAELPVQYADFAVWQRRWLRGEVLDGEIAWWRRQLAGLPPLLELPADRPRPAVQSYRGATRPVRLPAGLTRRLEALARSAGATLFMVLLAGFQALLARLSGQDDLAVGSPVAGRNRIEIEGLIGFFVNTLVLRGDLRGSPPFRELLDRARETALAAYAHQDVPFERLVEELAPERSLAYTPLFQVMLALQNAPVESLEIQGLRLRPVSRAGTTAKFDLLLDLSGARRRARGEIEYATDLFDATTIDRLAGHLERLLAAAVAAPELAVAALPLLTAAERASAAGGVERHRGFTGAGSRLSARAVRGAGAADPGSRGARRRHARRSSTASSIRRPSGWPRRLRDRRCRAGGDRRRLRWSARPAWWRLSSRSSRPEPPICRSTPAAAPAPRRDAGERPAPPLVLSSASLAAELPWSGPLVLAGRRCRGRRLRPRRSAAPRPGTWPTCSTPRARRGRPRASPSPTAAPSSWCAGPAASSVPAELAGVLAATSLSFDLSVFELFVPLSWGGTVILASGRPGAAGAARPAGG